MVKALACILDVVGAAGRWVSIASIYTPPNCCSNARCMARPSKGHYSVSSVNWRLYYDEVPACVIKGPANGQLSSSFKCWQHSLSLQGGISRWIALIWGRVFWGSWKAGTLVSNPYDDKIWWQNLHDYLSFVCNSLVHHVGKTSSLPLVILSPPVWHLHYQIPIPAIIR